MPKVALVHEWFITSAGSEKVVEQILQVFPEADLFALLDFLPQSGRAFLGGRSINTSFLQRFPLLNKRNYRQFLGLMPLAVEQFDLSGYDIVLSNCHAVSKGVITTPDQLHISYIHSPMRYAWDMQNEYLSTAGIGGLRGLAARLLLHYMRAWDAQAASRPDRLLANSGYIARRIEKTYRRSSTVLYPPVDTDYYTPGTGSRQDTYLAASRLVPYKRMDLIVEAFAAMPDRRLVVIGDGPEAARIRRHLTPNITWLGYQPDEVLRQHFRDCRAFIFAAREDFGIMPLEAQACGAPVIAYGAGGVSETVRGLGQDAPSGVFFREQSADAIRRAVIEFEASQDRIDPATCRANAERFSAARFRAEIREMVEQAWLQFRTAS